MDARGRLFQSAQRLSEHTLEANHWKPQLIFLWVI